MKRATVIRHVAFELGTLGSALHDAGVEVLGVSGAARGRARALWRQWPHV